MKKKTFYTEAAYIAGIAALAVGTALMEAADFGVSMIVAPAYLLHLQLSQTLPFFTFGFAEYTIQGLLLIAMCLVLKRFKVSYLFSFATALIYGTLLDLSMLVAALIPTGSVIVRIVCFFGGFLMCTAGVSLLFHTYISPEVYELFVKELSEKFGVDLYKFKTGYDCMSLVAAIVLSFVFFGFGHFEGIGWGTLVSAALNGFLIGRFTVIFEKRFEFADGLKFRPYFEK